MNVSVSNKGHYLPPAPDTDCNITSSGDFCKDAGNYNILGPR